MFKLQAGLLAGECLLSFLVRAQGCVPAQTLRPKRRLLWQPVRVLQRVPLKAQRGNEGGHAGDQGVGLHDASMASRRGQLAAELQGSPHANEMPVPSTSLLLKWSCRAGATRKAKAAAELHAAQVLHQRHSAGTLRGGVHTLLACMERIKKRE